MLILAKGLHIGTLQVTAHGCLSLRQKNIIEKAILGLHRYVTASHIGTYRHIPLPLLQLKFQDRQSARSCQAVHSEGRSTITLA